MMTKTYKIPYAIQTQNKQSAISYSPGTCGELMQGYLNGQDFLINSPIPFFSRVSILLRASGPVKVLSAGCFHKVRSVVKATLIALGYGHLGAEVEIESKIPRGKGLASSTSELTSAIMATAKALDEAISDELLTQIIIEVDRSSDGVFLPGITMCNHLTGKLFENFGAPPPLNFIIVDTGGEVTTNEFNRERARAVAKEHEEQLQEALFMLREGFATQNGALIASAATMSALVNQQILPKPMLSTLIEGTVEFGGLGVNCAHTGTVLGVMYNPNFTSTPLLMNRVKELVGDMPILGNYPLIAGGAFL